MFPRSLERVVVLTRPQCASSTFSTSHQSTRSTTFAISRPVLRCGHQRRYSSSKASCPSGGSKGASQQVAGGNPARLASRRKVKEAATVPPAMSAVHNLPSVPTTYNMNFVDVRLSSLFSLHRPISVNLPIPTSKTPASFNAIFEQKSPRGSRRSQDVVSTLSNTVSRLERESMSETEQGLSWQTIQDGESNTNSAFALDEDSSHPTLNTLLGQLVPFQAPPTPGPANEAGGIASQFAELHLPSTQTNSPDLANEGSRSKSWSVTINVTETTLPNGEKSVEATLSPASRINFTEDGPEPLSTPAAQNLFVQEPPLSRTRPGRRRRSNQGVAIGDMSQVTEMGKTREPSEMGEVGESGTAQEEGMLAISVKRQRRLKMKKHKYKKLMKRTRTLRRKLDRT